MVLNRSIACAPSPCGPAFPVSRLGGRYPADYYGHSVAVGLASLRRSHVHHCCTCRTWLRRPVRLLECPDRASLLWPRRIAAGDRLSRRRGQRRLQASFRRAFTCAFWRLGFRQSGFRHITRISRCAAP